MSEPTNVKINLMVTLSIRNYLDSLDNYSAYIRGLIKEDIDKKKSGKHKKLNV